ncbi:MAG TPA: PmoA family protein [Dermatophilaceae bacterium]|nr:PmoA family protein [Dermatophilaceae bacterium]
MSARAAARLSVRHDLDWSVQVAHHGQDLLTYVYAPDDVQLESPRPYFHPLHTLGGDLVTLFRPHDHVWHKGIAWSLPDVGPHNFWGGPNYVRDQGYVQLANDGSMDHDRFTAIDVADDRVEVGHELVWHAQPAADETAGKEIVREVRGFAVTVPADDAWVLTFSSTMTNVSGEQLDIGSPTTHGRENAGYGGLFWRGPRSFTGGTILAPGYAGGEEVRGTRAEWMGFTGQQDGTASHSTLVMVDDTANPQHPPQWFMRNEWFAGVNPAPFFSEEVPFGPGETLQFRYAVVIADGPADPDRGQKLADLGRAALRQLPPT